MKTPFDSDLRLQILPHEQQGVMALFTYCLYSVVKGRYAFYVFWRFSSPASDAARMFDRYNDDS